MRLLTALTLALALVAAGMTTTALAGNKGKGKAKQTTSVEKTVTKHLVGGLISAVERALIADYLDRNSASLPGAFAGAKPLPPGIAKKVARGGTLPPGIAKKTLPGGLLSQLPARPGQEWRVVGTDLLIVEIASNVIVDVLRGALRG
jgi:Ni/Co efflux regulator RcnB